MSLRSAIDAKCRDCIYDPTAGLGHWRRQVDACHVIACPLWAVRPRSKADKGAKSATSLTLRPLAVPTPRVASAPPGGAL